MGFVKCVNVYLNSVKSGSFVSILEQMHERVIKSHILCCGFT